jgi:hypothetical protein
MIYISSNNDRHPSLHFTQLHFTSLHYACRHFTSHLNFTQLHFTTVSFGYHVVGIEGYLKTVLFNGRAKSERQNNMEFCNILLQHYGGFPRGLCTAWRFFSSQHLSYVVKRSFAICEVRRSLGPLTYMKVSLVW